MCSSPRKQAHCPPIMTPIRVRGNSFPRALFYFFFLFARVLTEFGVFLNFFDNILVRRRWSKSRDKRPFWKGTITDLVLIPPQLSLIVHSIMTQKESKVIIMIALGSLFFRDLGSKKALFVSIFYFPGYFGASGPRSQELLRWSGLDEQVGED